LTPSHRFALGAVLALVPLIALWWVAADSISEGLRPIVALTATPLIPVEALRSDRQGGWQVETGLLVTSGKTIPGVEVATFNTDGRLLRRLSLSWPLLLALLLAPPRPPRLFLRIGTALAILAVLFIAGSLAELFSQVEILVNHATIFDNDTLPNIAVAAPPYSAATFFAGKLALYAALYFQPFVAPPLLWLALNPRARSLLSEMPGSSPGMTKT
jgi:hypothetical protein